MGCQISQARRLVPSDYVGNFKVRRLVSLNNVKRSMSEDIVGLTKASITSLMHARLNKTEHRIPEDVLCSMCRTSITRRQCQLNDVEGCRFGNALTRQSKSPKPGGKHDPPAPCHAYPKMYTTWQSRAMHVRRHAQSSSTKQGIPKGRPCSEMSNVVYPKIHAEGHCQTETARRKS